MADVNNPCLTTFDAPVNEVRISASSQDARIPYAGAWSAFWKVSDQLNRFLNSKFDVPCSVRASLIDVIEKSEQDRYARAACSEPS
jgi:hypothetical protein